MGTNMNMQTRYQSEPSSRLDQLSAKYGECCTRKTAGEILSRCPASVSQMLRDGRLRECCEGKMVDMASIAEYMDKPKYEDRKVRLTKKYGREPSCFV